MAENEKKISDKATDAKAAKKSKKPSIWSRIGSWFKSLKSECKKIAWANAKTVRTNSIVVIVCVIACSIVLGILDYLFSTAIIGLGMLI